MVVFSAKVRPFDIVVVREAVDDFVNESGSLLPSGPHSLNKGPRTYFQLKIHSEAAAVISRRPPEISGLSVPLFRLPHKSR